MGSREGGVGTLTTMSSHRDIWAFLTVRFTYGLIFESLHLKLIICFSIALIASYFIVYY